MYGGIEFMSVTYKAALFMKFLRAAMSTTIGYNMAETEHGNIDYLTEIAIFEATYGTAPAIADR